MPPVSPAPVRLRRANPTSCEPQAQPAMPLAAAFGVDVPDEEPAAGLTSEPTQVRYWRTPNRLMNQVWARKPDSTMPLTAATDDLHEGEVPLQGEILQGEVDIVPMRREEDSAASLDVIPAAPTPFAFISDHAFWEGLSGAAPDEVEAEPDDAYCGGAGLQGTSPVLAELLSAPDDNIAINHEPPVAPAPAPVTAARPAPALVARGSAARASLASHVNVRGSVRPQSETGQGAAAISASAQGVAGDSAASGRGIAVSRKIRDDVAARAKLSSDQAGNAANIDHADDFALPPITFLTEPPQALGAAIPTELLQQNAGLLEGVLEDFNVRGEIVQACPGPVVTLYELEPAPGTKSSRVIALADDIARSMSAISARVAVVQGKNAIGIELPNAKRETVFLRELLASQDFDSTKHKLALCLGKTIGGEPVIVDLAKMPHLLVAGTTGSGKSVAINTMILSLLYRLKPEQCRLIMVDPKMLELSVYDGIPHLLTPVVTDPKKAVVALKWAVREMEERYKKMSKVAVRNIDGFNARVGEAKAAGEVITRTVQTGFDKHSGEAIYEEEVMDLEPLPYIVVIVDE
ncbi:FtsK/SpoIIIE family protein, partial [Bosea lathyri]